MATSPSGSQFAEQLGAAVATQVSQQLARGQLDGVIREFTFSDSNGTGHTWTIKVEGWDTCIRVLAAAQAPEPLSQHRQAINAALAGLPAMSELQVTGGTITFLLNKQG